MLLRLSRQFSWHRRFLHSSTSESAERRALSLLLRNHSQTKSIEQCKEIHSQLIISGAIVDTFFPNSLISFYSRCGDLQSARLVFDQMLQKNVVSWTSMIAADVHSGCSGTALELFKSMISSNERPNQFTFSVAVHASTSLQLLKAGIQVHGLILRYGLEKDEFAGSSLVDLYSKMGLIDCACRVFDGLFYRDTVSWNIMISGSSQAGDSAAAFRQFSEMRFEEGVNPNDFTCTSLLKCCDSSREIEQIHGFCIKSAFELDVVVGSALIDAYFKCGNTGSGREVLDIMPEKDGFAWCSAISGYARNGRGQEALNLFKEMHALRVRVDRHALSGAMKASLEVQNAETGYQVHGLMIKVGCQGDCLAASVLLELYSGFNRMNDAEKIFRKIHDKDIVSWNLMLIGCAEVDEFAPACIDLFCKLARTGMKPDGFTFTGILKSCRSNLDLKTGCMIHAQVAKSAHGTEINVGNAVINMYSKCGAVYDAEKAFETMICRDDVSWSTIIGTYEQNGLQVEALRRSREMVAAGFNLTQFSFASCISASAGLAALDVGRQFHSSVIKAGFGEDVYVGSSVVDMYAKCGNVEDSTRAFHDLKNPNIVAYNALITGFGQHGRAEEAIQMFEELERAGIMPNRTTFIGLLTGCSHAGLLRESISFFNLMDGKNKIKPESEHYCCLVDVYGRAGKLEEAYELISRSHSSSSVAVWRTLLSACRKYKNVRIGEESAKRGMELEPEDHASYVLLSNLYSEVGLWKEAMEVREKMAGIGVRKDPGSSWVAVRDRVHEFMVGDYSHSEIEGILTELGMLNQQITADDALDVIVDNL